jgi:hypothetical protein
MPTSPDFFITKSADFHLQVFLFQFILILYQGALLTEKIIVDRACYFALQTDAQNLLNV